MGYRVKTKIENGVEKIDARPSPYDKRKTMYLVINNKKQGKEVDKKWLIEHISEIENIGLSGNSLYLKSKYKEKVKEKVNEDTKKVNENTKTETKFIKRNAEFLEKHLVSNFQSSLPKLLKKLGITDVCISDYSDWFDLYRASGYRFNYRPSPYCMGFSSMRGEYNSYPFKDNGSFALWYSLEYDDINETLILILNLSNYYIKSSPTVWDNITSKPIETFVSKKIILCENVELIDRKQYGISRNGKNGLWYLDKLNKKYSGNVYAIKRDNSVEGRNNSLCFIDAKSGDIAIQNAIQVYQKFIKENKDTILKYLYAPKGVKTFKRAEIMTVGNITIEKAEKLVKEGYSIVVNDVPMTIAQLKEKQKRDLYSSPSKHWGSMSVKVYHDIYDFVDTYDKVYYIKLGEAESHDMWC